MPKLKTNWIIISKLVLDVYLRSVHRLNFKPLIGVPFAILRQGLHKIFVAYLSVTRWWYFRLIIFANIFFSYSHAILNLNQSKTYHV